MQHIRSTLFLHSRFVKTTWTTLPFGVSQNRQLFTDEFSPKKRGRNALIFSVLQPISVLKIILIWNDLQKKLPQLCIFLLYFCFFVSFLGIRGKVGISGPYPLVKAYMSFCVHVYTLGIYIYIKWWNFSPVIQLSPYFCPWLFTCSLHLSTLNRWIWWS